MSKNKTLLFLCLIISLLFFKDNIKCSVIALYYNLFPKVNYNNFTINKPFYTVFEELSFAKLGHTITGLDYWNGYSIRIKKFQELKKVNEYFKIRIKIAKDSKSSVATMLNDSLYFIKNHNRDNELMYKNNFYFVHLLQVSNQDKYMNKSIQLKYINEIFLTDYNLRVKP